MIFESEIQDIVRRTHNVKSFQVRAPAEASYQAGQFMLVTIKVDQTLVNKYLSISSSPTQKGLIEFTKKITASDFSQTLDRMKPGGWVKIDMPKGAFTLDKADAKIAFLSGGIGITPIYSICRYVMDEKLDKDIILLYGNRTEHDIVFKEELEQMSRDHARFRVVHTLEAPQDASGWKGRTGFISEAMIREEIPDYSGRTFFVCGPPGMVKVLSELLINQLHLPPEQLVKENFMGY
ncbi:MAG TPA: FAD-binding oxidoreductase [Candidatus Bathyarchaeia archaeon]|nr:FAD-binding oxidoreductase [Candidatus Bathyarchaeia archaeon]